MAVQALLTGALVSFLAGALYAFLAKLVDDQSDLPLLLAFAPSAAVFMAAMSGLLPVVGFLTDRSAAWVRRAATRQVTQRPDRVATTLGE